MALRETLNHISRMNAPPNEQETITRIIFPILKDLGWDVDNNIRYNEEVRQQYQVVVGSKKGILDIALMEDNRCVWVVEAKRPGVNLIRSVGQVLWYAYCEGATFCALTDGLEWRLYLPFEKVRPEEREFAVLQLKGNPMKQSENDLKSFLSREAVLSGDAQRDAVRQLAVRQLKQVAKDYSQDSHPSQLTYSNNSASSKVSDRQGSKGQINYTLFGVPKSRSGIGVWADVVEELYLRHERDFLERAEKLKLTPGSRRVLISGNPQSISRSKPTKAPGVYIEYSLTQIECLRLAHQLLKLFGYPPSDLYFNDDGTKLSDFGSKLPNSGVSREVDKRPTGYTLFGVYSPWRSGIGMWADVVKEVYFRHENDFLEKAQELRLNRSNRFLKDGVLISDNPEKINRPRGPIRPRGTSVPIYIERSLKVDVLIELAYDLLKLFGHPPSDLYIHE